MMGIRILTQKRRDNNEQKEEQYENEEKEKKTKRNRFILILAIPILAIIAIVIFLLTQDMRNLMVMVDWWTIAHVIIFVGGLLSYIFAFRRKKDEDEDDKEYASDDMQYEAN